MAALELVRFFARDKETLVGRLLSLDLETIVATTHWLSKRPQCSQCGTPPPTEVKLQLQSQPIPAADELER